MYSGSIPRSVGCSRPVIRCAPPLSELLAHRARNPPSSSSLAEERTPPLAPPPCGGARFPTLAATAQQPGKPGSSAGSRAVIQRRGGAADPVGTWMGLAGAHRGRGSRPRWADGCPDRVRWPPSRRSCEADQPPSARSARCTAAWASWILFWYAARSPSVSALSAALNDA